MKRQHCQNRDEVRIPETERAGAGPMRVEAVVHRLLYRTDRMFTESLGSGIPASGTPSRGGMRSWGLLVQRPKLKKANAVSSTLVEARAMT